MLEKFLIDSKYFFVVTEDVVEFPDRESVLCSNGFDPLFHFTEVDVGHIDIIVDEVYHKGSSIV